MFADDTNLFLSHQNVNTLFKISNEELKKFRNWFKANKNKSHHKTNVGWFIESSSQKIEK